MYRADLHIHTNVSDCSMKAEEVLQLAKKAGITHLAFTDHDTTFMAQEHQELASLYGIRAIPGVELSAYDYRENKKVHILGYNYQTTSHIEEIGRETLRQRNENCLRQMEILRTLGFIVEEEKIKEMSCTCIYKQHILDYLVQTGQSEELFGDVYKKIFKNQGSCDFDIQYPAAEDAVRAVKADGGYAVLAHPGQMGNYGMIHRLADAGLDGIEWNHPSHSEADRKKIYEFAKSYQLFLTGGSDFHGRYEKKPGRLGRYPADDSSWILFGK